LIIARIEKKLSIAGSPVFASIRRLSRSLHPSLVGWTKYAIGCVSWTVIG
jgi:hypothetical protein